MKLSIYDRSKSPTTNKYSKSSAPPQGYTYLTNEITNESLESLLIHTNLTTLNLSRIPLNQKSLTFLLNALDHSQSKSSPYASELNKYSMPLSSSTSSTIPSNNNTSLISLKQLILCYCQLTLPSIEMILNAIKNHTSLRVLRLAGNVKDYQMTNTSSSDDEDSDEDHSNQDNNGSSTNTALSMTILNSLLTSSNSQLELIDLSYNKLPVAMLFQLISAFNNLQPHLHTMDLSGMDLGISCTELLAKNLKSYFTSTTLTSSSNSKALKTLLLSNNKIRPKGILLLMKTILECTSIKELDLSQNLFTDSISEEFSELFKISPQKQNSLQILGLAGYKNQDENEDIKDYEYLHNRNKYLCSMSDSDRESDSEPESDSETSTSEKTNKISKNKENLKGTNDDGCSSNNKNSNNNKNETNPYQNNSPNERNFSEFSFGNVGCQKMIKNLRYYSGQLTSLDLSYQQIENNTLELLGSQLCYLPFLLLLDLQYNYITDHGLISFIDIMDKNNKINNQSNKKNDDKNTRDNDTETIIHLEYNYINFACCREQIKNFNCNSKNNYIIYAKNQNIN